MATPIYHETLAQYQLDAEPMLTTLAQHPGLGESGDYRAGIKWTSTSSRLTHLSFKTDCCAKNVLCSFTLSTYRPKCITLFNPLSAEHD